MRLIVGASCAVVLATVTHLRAVDGPLACADVAKLALPHGTITQVEAVAAGAFKPSERPNDYRSLPAFCRVAMTLAPSADSDIKVELWIPAHNWNGKFQAVGNGAFSGAIAYPAMAERVDKGLRDKLHGYWTHGRWCELGARTPGKGRGLRLACRSRNDVRIQEGHRQPHRPRAGVLVLERLLRGWPAGDEGSAALPGRFQRHHCRCARPRLDRARGAGGPDCENARAQRRRPPVHQRQTSAASRRRRRVRCGRWPEGRPDLGS